MIIKVGERITELRNKYNLTQHALAKELGVSRSSVNAWEMGISMPTIDRLIDIAEYFHVSVDYLLGFKPIPKSESEEESEEESKAASKSKKAASKAVPPRNRTLDNRVIFTKLRHDYQDPNRDKLQTAKTKQLPIDDYFKIIGREKEVTDFTNKVDEAKYNKPNVIASINKQEEQFIKQMQSSSNRNSPIVRGYVGKKKIYK